MGSIAESNYEPALVARHLARLQPTLLALRAAGITNIRLYEDRDGDPYMCYSPHSRVPTGLDSELDDFWRNLRDELPTPEQIKIDLTTNTIVITERFVSYREDDTTFDLAGQALDYREGAWT